MFNPVSDKASDIRGNKTKITSSRILELEKNVYQVELGMDRKGFSIILNDPEVARFISFMFETVAKKFEKNSSKKMKKKEEN